MTESIIKLYNDDMMTTEEVATHLWDDFYSKEDIGKMNEEIELDNIEYVENIIEAYLTHYLRDELAPTDELFIDIFESMVDIALDR